MVGRLKARRAKPAAKKKEPEKLVLDSSDSDFQHDEVKEKNVCTKNTKLVKITRKAVTENKQKRTNKKKVKNLKPLEAYFVEEDVKRVANLEKFGPSVDVWKKDDIIVSLKDMDNIRNGNILEKQVVEAGFVIGQKLHDDMLVSNTQELFVNRKCDYIPNVMYYLNQIDRNEKNEVYEEEAKKMVYEKWHKMNDSMTHFLMIPIYTETKKKDIGHWTLLVCNLEDEREEGWTNYNSRRELEIANNEALRVFYYIREVFPSPTLEYENLTPVTLKFSESCPQQKNNLDSGLFVLMYANDIYKLGKVKETYSIEEVNQFRANLYSGIVTDWERTIKYVIDPEQDQSQIADVGTKNIIK